MKIAIIDRRSDQDYRGHALRAKDLVDFLQDNNDSYEVDMFSHVNFGAFVAPHWTNDKRKEIEISAEPYKVIVLHVGPEQTLALESLTEAFRGTYVLCFTGTSITDELRNDCHANQNHSYIKDLIGADDAWPAFWKKRILEYLRLLEQEKPEDARNLIMDYNIELEKALNELTSNLRGFVESLVPMENIIENLSAERDEKLRKAYERREDQFVDVGQ